MEEFLTGRRIGPEATRVVATVMFTDVVGSTARAEAVGDSAWTDLLRAHDSRLRAEIRRFGGREIDTAGDGFFSSFPSPTAAIRCALAVQATVREIGIEVRIGLHTGECEVAGDKLRGRRRSHRRAGGGEGGRRRRAGLADRQGRRDRVRVRLRGRGRARAQGDPRPVAPVSSRSTVGSAHPSGTLRLWRCRRHSSFDSLVTLPGERSRAGRRCRAPRRACRQPPLACWAS